MGLPLGSALKLSSLLFVLLLTVFLTSKAAPNTVKNPPKIPLANSEGTLPKPKEEESVEIPFVASKVKNKINNNSNSEIIIADDDIVSENDVLDSLEDMNGLSANFSPENFKKRSAVMGVKDLEDILTNNNNNNNKNLLSNIINSKKGDIAPVPLANNAKDEDNVYGLKSSYWDSLEYLAGGNDIDIAVNSVEMKTSLENLLEQGGVPPMYPVQYNPG